MGILEFPSGRVSNRSERVAFRRGVSVTSRTGAAFQLMQRKSPAAAYCAACAAPIDFGLVWQAGEAYCSVECSLGGDRPA